MTTTEPIAAPVVAEAAPLDVVRRARDLVVVALSATTPTIAELEALAELDAECRARAGGTEPDALSRLLFLLRQRQSEVERRIAHVRRRHMS